MKNQMDSNKLIFGIFLLMLTIWILLFSLSIHHLEFVKVGNFDRVIYNGLVKISEVDSSSPKWLSLLESSKNTQEYVNKANMALYMISIFLTAQLINFNKRQINIALSILVFNVALSKIYSILFLDKVFHYSGVVTIFLDEPKAALISAISILIIPKFVKVKRDELLGISAWVMIPLMFWGMFISELLKNVF